MYISNHSSIFSKTAKRIISLILLAAFLFTNTDFALAQDALSPTSRFNPITQEDGKDAKLALIKRFQEQLGFLSLSKLIGEGLYLELHEFGIKKHIEKNLPKNVKFASFDYSRIHKKGSSFYLPYKLNTGEEVLLRYFKLEGDTIPAGVVRIALDDGKFVGREIVGTSASTVFVPSGDLDVATEHKQAPGYTIKILEKEAIEEYARQIVNLDKAAGDINIEDAYAVVVEDKTNRVLGSAAVGPSKISIGSFYIHDLFVDEDYKKTGIATELLTVLIKECVAKGAKSFIANIDRKSSFYDFSQKAFMNAALQLGLEFGVETSEGMNVVKISAESLAQTISDMLWPVYTVKDLSGRTILINGYGTIGSKIAEVAKKFGASIVVSDTNKWKQYIAIDNKYASYASAREALVKNPNIDVIIDCTPPGEGAKMKELYSGRKVIYQGGEAFDIADLNFAQAVSDYPDVADKNIVRVVTCNTSAMLNVFTPLLEQFKDLDINISIENAPEHKPESYIGIEHQAADRHKIRLLKLLPANLRKNIKQIETAATTNPKLKHFHMHRALIKAKGLTADRVKQILSAQRRIAVVELGKEKFEAEGLYNLVQPIAEHPMVVVAQVLPTDSKDEVAIDYAVPHESNVIPENIDALYALLGLRSREQSYEIINNVLEIGKIKKHIEAIAGDETVPEKPLPIINKHIIINEERFTIQTLEREDLEKARLLNNEAWHDSFYLTEDIAEIIFRNNQGGHLVIRNEKGEIIALLWCASLYAENTDGIPDSLRAILSIERNTGKKPDNVWVHYAVAVKPDYRRGGGGPRFASELLKATEPLSEGMGRYTHSPLSGYWDFIMEESETDHMTPTFYLMLLSPSKHSIGPGIKKEILRKDEEAYLDFKEEGKASFREWLEAKGKAPTKIEWKDYISFVKEGHLSLEDYVLIYKRSLISRAPNVHVKNGAKIIRVIPGGREFDSDAAEAAVITEYRPIPAVKTGDDSISPKTPSKESDYAPGTSSASDASPAADHMKQEEALEENIKSIGMDIFERAIAYEKDWRRFFTIAGLRYAIVNRIMRWAMKDEHTKLMILYFIDVMPGLNSREIIKHMLQYFPIGDRGLPLSLRMAAAIGIAVGSVPYIGSILVASIVRTVVRITAHNFLAGETEKDVLKAIRNLKKKGMGHTIDVVGEAVLSEENAEVYVDTYVRKLLSNDYLKDELDNVSLKLSALYSEFDPIDNQGTKERVKRRLKRIIDAAKNRNVFINIDMEQYAYKDITLEIFKEVLLEDEALNKGNFGIALQAYLKDSEKDLLGLIEFARKYNKTFTVRLVKGTYWEYETSIAEARGWDTPVFDKKYQTDLNYERLTGILFENRQLVGCAFATHNIRTIASVIARAESLGIPKDEFEFQFLRGMGDPIKYALIDKGYRVRVYLPYGKPIVGMQYLARRILENTSNDSFLRQTFLDRKEAEKLLARPAETAKAVIAEEPLEEEVIGAGEITGKPSVDALWRYYAEILQSRSKGAVKSFSAEKNDYVYMPRGNGAVIFARDPTRWELMNAIIAPLVSGNKIKTISASLMAEPDVKKLIKELRKKGLISQRIRIVRYRRDLSIEFGQRSDLDWIFYQGTEDTAQMLRRVASHGSGRSSMIRKVITEITPDFLMEFVIPKTITENMLRRGYAPQIAKVSRKEKEFVNEPATDFSKMAEQDNMAKAIKKVGDEIRARKAPYPLIIGGRPVMNSNFIQSIDPAHPDFVVGTVSRANIGDAAAAVQEARKALSLWAGKSVEERAGYLHKAADIIRGRRFELAAWMIYEIGKNWREAMGDVEEAIDYLDYYAYEAVRVEEEDKAIYGGNWKREPRGVCAVISPWNFPLAILVGMTSAALVTGNTVIMKPAEQSPVIAYKFMQIMQEVGLPDGTMAYLPGIGEEVGNHLVNDPNVDMIAFTGSEKVGLSINENAARVRARRPKKVITEMGGKNAIIIDSSADLDEAVLGVVLSAFGYSGQKCSACSRVIVAEDVYEEFLERLKGKVAAIKIGDPKDPATLVGPLIDREAKEKVEGFVERAKKKGINVLIERDLEGLIKTKEIDGEAYYAAPIVFRDVPPTDEIAQEEIFGPVLAVMKAKDFDEALSIANGTRFALTGGVYSRTPSNIERAKVEFAVRNLYINRKITGAMVAQQPFSKAGGIDYLAQFTHWEPLPGHDVQIGPGKQDLNQGLSQGKLSNLLLIGSGPAGVLVILAYFLYKLYLKNKSIRLKLIDDINQRVAKIEFKYPGALMEYPGLKAMVEKGPSFNSSILEDLSGRYPILKELSRQVSIFEEYLLPTELCDFTFAKDDPIREKAKSLVRGKKSTQEKFEALRDFVQNKIKYAFDEWDVKAQETLEKGSGMCANKANLLVAMCRSIGIQARYRVCKIDKNKRFWEILCDEIPALDGVIEKIPDQLDHILVEVNIDGRWPAYDVDIDSQMQKVFKARRIDLIHERRHSKGEPLSNIDAWVEERMKNAHIKDNREVIFGILNLSLEELRGNLGNKDTSQPKLRVPVEEEHYADSLRSPRGFNWEEDMNIRRQIDPYGINNASPYKFNQPLFGRVMDVSHFTGGFEQQESKSSRLAHPQPDEPKLNRRVKQLLENNTIIELFKRELLSQHGLIVLEETLRRWHDKIEKSLLTNTELGTTLDQIDELLPDEVNKKTRAFLGEYFKGQNTDISSLFFSEVVKEKSNFSYFLNKGLRGYADSYSDFKKDNEDINAKLKMLKLGEEIYLFLRRIYLYDKELAGAYEFIPYGEAATGSFYNVYSVLQLPEFEKRFVPLEKIAEKAKGKPEDVLLSLVFFGLVEKQGEKERAEYKAADLDSRKDMIAKFILRKLKSRRLDDVERQAVKEELESLWRSNEMVLSGILKGFTSDEMAGRLEALELTVLLSNSVLREAQGRIKNDIIPRIKNYSKDHPGELTYKEKDLIAFFKLASGVITALYGEYLSKGFLKKGKAKTLVQNDIGKFIVNLNEKEDIRQAYRILKTLIDEKGGIRKEAIDEARRLDKAGRKALADSLEEIMAKFINMIYLSEKRSLTAGDKALYVELKNLFNELKPGAETRLPPYIKSPHEYLTELLNGFIAYRDMRTRLEGLKIAALLDNAGLEKAQDIIDEITYEVDKTHKKEEEVIAFFGLAKKVIDAIYVLHDEHLLAKSLNYNIYYKEAVDLIQKKIGDFKKEEEAKRIKKAEALKKQIEAYNKEKVAEMKKRFGSNGLDECVAALKITAELNRSSLTEIESWLSMTIYGHATHNKISANGIDHYEMDDVIAFLPFAVSVIDKLRDKYQESPREIKDSFIEENIVRFKKGREEKHKAELRLQILQDRLEKIKEPLQKRILTNIRKGFASDNMKERLKSLELLASLDYASLKEVRAFVVEAIGAYGKTPPELLRQEEKDFISFLKLAQIIIPKLYEERYPHKTIGVEKAKELIEEERKELENKLDIEHAEALLQQLVSEREDMRKGAAIEAENLGDAGRAWLVESLIKAAKDLRDSAKEKLFFTNEERALYHEWTTLVNELKPDAMPKALPYPQTLLERSTQKAVTTLLREAYFDEYNLKEVLQGFVSKDIEERLKALESVALLSSTALKQCLDIVDKDIEDITKYAKDHKGELTQRQKDMLEFFELAKGIIYGLYSRHLNNGIIDLKETEESVLDSIDGFREKMKERPAVAPVIALEDTVEEISVTELSSGLETPPFLEQAGVIPEEVYARFSEPATLGWGPGAQGSNQPPDNELSEEELYPKWRIEENRTLPSMLYHLRVDSIVSFHPAVWLLKPKESKYKPRRYEVSPETIAPDSPAYPEHQKRIRKLEEAIKILEKRGSADRAKELKATTTILGLNMMTNLIFSDRENKIYRAMHIGRGRQVIYFSLWLLDNIDAELLAMLLNYAQGWIDTYNHLVETGATPEEIHKHLSAEIGEEGIGSLKILNKRLEELSDLDEEIIQIAIRPKMDEEIAEAYMMRDRLEKRWKDEIIDETNIARFRNDYMALSRTLGAVGNRCENLGKLDIARTFYQGSVQMLKNVQKKDTGLAPIELQERIIYLLLKDAMLPEFIKELRVFLTGEGFPRELTEDEESIRASFLSTHFDIFKRNVLYFLSLYGSIITEEGLLEALRDINWQAVQLFQDFEKGEKGIDSISDLRQVQESKIKSSGLDITRILPGTKIGGGVSEPVAQETRRFNPIPGVNIGGMTEELTPKSRRFSPIPGIDVGGMAEKSEPSRNRTVLYPSSPSSQGTPLIPDSHPVQEGIVEIEPKGELPPIPGLPDEGIEKLHVRKDGAEPNAEQKIITSDMAEIPSKEELGEKAYKIIKMAEAGLNVPPFIIIVGDGTGKIKITAELRDLFMRLKTPVMVRSAHRDEGREYPFSGIFTSFEDIVFLESQPTEIVNRESDEYYDHGRKVQSVETAYTEMIGDANPKENNKLQDYLDRHKIKDFNPNGMNAICMEQIELEVFGMFTTSSQTNSKETIIHFEVRKSLDRRKIRGIQAGAVKYNKITNELELDGKDINPYVQKILIQFGQNASKIENLFGVQLVEMGASRGKAYVFQSRDIDLGNPEYAPRLSHYKSLLHSRPLGVDGYGYFNLPVLVIDSLEATKPGLKNSKAWVDLNKQYSEARKRNDDKEAYRISQEIDRLIDSWRDEYKSELKKFREEHPEYILVIKDMSDVILKESIGLGEHRDYSFLNSMIEGARVVIKKVGHHASVRHPDWDLIDKGGIDIIISGDSYDMNIFRSESSKKPDAKIIRETPSEKQTIQIVKEITTGDRLNVLSNTDGVFIWLGDSLDSTVKGTGSSSISDLHLVQEYPRSLRDFGEDIVEKVRHLEFINVSPGPQSMKFGTIEATFKGRRYWIKRARPPLFWPQETSKKIARNEFDILRVLNPLGEDKDFPFACFIDEALEAICVTDVEGIAMEHLLWKLRELPEKEKLDFAIRLARTIEKIHSKGVFHRDIMPEHILIREDSSIGMIDFDLSLSGDYDLSRNELPFLRSIRHQHYSAPERETIQGYDAFMFNDVYSFGATLKDIANREHDKQLLEIIRRCEDYIYKDFGEIIRDLEKDALGSPTPEPLGTPLISDSGTALISDLYQVQDEEEWGAVVADTVILRAREAKKKGENIIIGLESNGWIPEMQKKMNLIQPLLNGFINRLEAKLREIGLDNVKIVSGVGEDLKANVLYEKDRLNVKDQNIVILASKETVNSDKFSALWNRVFLAGIDTALIKEEAASKPNYVRLLEMIKIALDLAFKEANAKALESEHPYIGIDSDSLARKGIILLIPKAEPKDIEELRNIYNAQLEALFAA